MKRVEIVDKGICDVIAISFKTFNRIYVLPKTKNTKLNILGLKEDIELCVRKQGNSVTTVLIFQFHISDQFSSNYR